MLSNEGVRLVFSGEDKFVVRQGVRYLAFNQCLHKSYRFLFHS